MFINLKNRGLSYLNTITSFARLLPGVGSSFDGFCIENVLIFASVKDRIEFGTFLNRVDTWVDRALSTKARSIVYLIDF